MKQALCLVAGAFRLKEFRNKNKVAFPTWALQAGSHICLRWSRKHTEDEDQPTSLTLWLPSITFKNMHSVWARTNSTKSQNCHNSHKPTQQPKQETEQGHRRGQVRKRGMSRTVALFLSQFQEPFCVRKRSQVPKDTQIHGVSSSSCKHVSRTTDSSI